LKQLKYFITAIGTDSGKTVASAILCEALKADYWKPVQCGLPRDADSVQNLLKDSECIVHPEQYLLKTPASPHAAALLENVTISLDSFKLPQTENTLIIEGAGGCLVPLNNKDLVIDLIASFDAETIVVSNLYLGSINHTLLTVEALQRRNLPIKGLIFNGERNDETERIILHRTGLKCLFRIHREPVIDRHIVKRYAMQLKGRLA
jgi:dethiobiotin synthetase